MNTAIHPYKGYLNTSFHLYVRGENPLAYDVYNNEQKKSSLIFSGSANPNQPCKIKMPQSGVYTIKFSNGESHKIQVLDGYKYGGNKLKRAFVFDECNWAFVIMHDRTYFYNRQNKLSFVEAISPDEIEVVSADYVLLKNSNQEELTLFSLEEQKPILWLKNVEFYSSKAIVWLEDNHNEGNDKSAYTLNTYNLSEQRLVKILCKDFTIEKKHESLLFYTENNISRLNFSNFEITPVECECKNLQFTTFVEDHFAIYTNNDQSILTLFDLYNDENRGKIFVNGTLARVNNHVLINVDERINALRKFDFNSFILPESKICASYVEYDFYPQDWEKSVKGGDIRTIYKETVTNLSANKSKYRKTNIERTTTCFIKSFETDFSQVLLNENGKVVYRENCFVFYNATESLTIPRYYPRSIRYQKGARIMLAGNVLLMVCDDAIYRLNKNGFWEYPILGKYDTSLLENFHVLKNIEDKSYVTLNEYNLGYLRCQNFVPTPCLQFDSTVVYPGGEYLTEDTILDAVSPQAKYGISVKSGKVEFFYLYNHKIKSSCEILEDLFDYSEYKNVLLSEDGKHIIYRDVNQTRMLNLAIGESIDFDNLSYINHINGIRPLFRVLHNSQAILINPANGLHVENELINEYCFVSPDYKFYADKDINKYIEYYDKISKRIISSEEYVQFKNTLEYRHISNNAHDEMIKNNRTDFIQRNLDFFCELSAFKDKREEDVLNTLALRNLLYNHSFVDLFIEKKGVAVIRKVADKSEYLRVPLGLPLWFLNYVSFSKDSKYVAIAGRYPNDSGYSGLFLVYNIQKREPIIVEKSSYAVWTTAFNNDNIVAAYTSCPNSFVGNVFEYKECENSEIRYRDKAFNVRDYNFLTFSPNGKYFACSQQGYICYNKTDDTINQNWGHQPSSIVSIRLSTSPDRELIVFDDLSELGIADVNTKISVASVSFSNDNQHIMMVGNDGVVVVRNLHLKENFEYDEYESDEYNYDTDYGTHYGEYAGSYAQDIMGYSDDVINDAFDGDPDAYWNID